MVDIPAGMDVIRARYIPIKDEFTMPIPADAVLLGVGIQEEHVVLWYAVLLRNENPHRYRLFFWRLYGRAAATGLWAALRRDHSRQERGGPAQAVPRSFPVGRRAGERAIPWLARKA